jgi:hypothetical protein
MRNNVYLRRLQYEIPYAHNAPSVTGGYKYQDDLVTRFIAGQDALSTQGRDAAAAESTILSRYGIAYKQYMNFLTGFPEYLK